MLLTFKNILHHTTHSAGSVSPRTTTDAAGSMLQRVSAAAETHSENCHKDVQFSRAANQPQANTAASAPDADPPIDTAVRRVMAPAATLSDAVGTVSSTHRFYPFAGVLSLYQSQHHSQTFPLMS